MKKLLKDARSKTLTNYMKNKSHSRVTNDDDRKKIWLDLQTRREVMLTLLLSTEQTNCLRFV